MAVVRRGAPTGRALARWDLAFLNTRSRGVKRPLVMTLNHYQNLVIGSGEAGKVLAWNLAKIGQKTAVVERSMIGGSRPNVACLPSKNGIYSPKAFSLVDPPSRLPAGPGGPRVGMAAA